MKSAVFARRVFSVFAAAMLVATTFAPVDADARAGRGGSFGSRGSRTFDAAPPTATSPGAQQMQRSNQPGLGNPSPSAAAPRPGAQRTGGMFGGGLMGGIMGGLLGAGLFGLLSGSGFLGGLGSLASMLGLIIQIVLVVIVVRFAMNWFRNRNQTQAPRTPYAAPAGAAPSGGGYGGAPQPSAPVNSDRFEYGSRSSVPPAGGGFGGGSYGGAQRPEYGEVTIGAADYDAFQKLLSDVQEAWSRQDLGTLHRLATPEMSQMFADDLAELTRDGVANRVSNVKLLQGDLSESWSENNEDYATVAMRYELVDVTEDIRTRQVVDGDPSRPTEATELWTFVRPSQGGEWRLSAVQQSEEQKKGLFGGLFG
ncbi:TIM44-like domain-containing protein [Methylopila sp. M107]|uniref:Tim44 domain-containing protein n=1 Tax=Methylopila sp. M107 TaxID=1101190 RepID=UPI0003663CEF|nr:TIM44-like domain-containing protein [Methylopila sp. M107]